MNETAAPPDDEILAALRPAFGDRTITSLRRRPYLYATSYPLEEVQLRFDHGSDANVIFKDLAWDRLLPNARESRPRFLHEPRRSVETYRQILAPANIGPHCYAAVAEPESLRYWLFLEKVAGVELWQVGELEIWESVASWLGRFHASFAGRVEGLRATNPFLIACDASWFTLWCERARKAIAISDDARAPQLLRALDDYGSHVDALAALPTTFLHGEFYPSNVLIGPLQADRRVCPIDWEMAAIGPGLLDLAALAGGWDPTARGQLVDAYRAALAGAGAPVSPLEQTLDDLDRCELHFALQWLGWSSGWQPPLEHARDWIGEALASFGRLVV